MLRLAVTFGTISVMNYPRSGSNHPGTCDPINIPTREVDLYFMQTMQTRYIRAGTPSEACNCYIPLIPERLAIGCHWWRRAQRP